MTCIVTFFVLLLVFPLCACVNLDAYERTRRQQDQQIEKRRSEEKEAENEKQKNKISKAYFYDWMDYLSLRSFSKDYNVTREGAEKILSINIKITKDDLVLDSIRRAMSENNLFFVCDNSIIEQINSFDKSYKMSNLRPGNYALNEIIDKLHEFGTFDSSELIYGQGEKSGRKKIEARLFFFFTKNSLNLTLIPIEPPNE